MMDTILNLGLNDAVAEGLAAQHRRARASRSTRTGASSSMHASDRARRAAGALRPRPRRGARPRRRRAKGIDTTRLNAEELKRRVPDADLPCRGAEGARRGVQGASSRRRPGSDFPSDPREQLWQAVEAVFRSWNNHRAVVYRRMHDIPDDWGTACNVQAMVFGNLGDTSATGVAFTRDPSTGEKKLYGEWLPNAQGEDVVAGIRTPLPLRDDRHAPTTQSLEVKMPEAYRRARLASRRRSRSHFRDMQDLEFTIQGGKLYMLQCRDREARGARRGACRGRHGQGGARHARTRPCCGSTPGASTSSSTRRSTRHAPKKLLARGLSASPGAAQRPHRLQRRRGRAPRRAGQARHPRARRDVARGHPRDEGRARHPDGARRDDEPRGGRRARHGQAVRRRGQRRGRQLRDADDDRHGLRRAPAGPTENVTLKKGDIITHRRRQRATSTRARCRPSARRSSGEFGELMSWADAARTMKVRANADTPLDARTARALRRRGHRPLPDRAHVLRGGANRGRCAR